MPEGRRSPRGLRPAADGARNLHQSHSHGKTERERERESRVMNGAFLEADREALIETLLRELDCRARHRDLFDESVDANG